MRLSARAPQAARRLPAGAQGAYRAAGRARARGLSACWKAAATARSRPRWLRAPAHDACCATRHRQARRADRARRGAHLRHGRHVPPDRHLFLGGPALHAAGRGPADVLPRGQAGPDPRGGHQRGGRLLLVDRGGTSYANHGVSHDAVLHLLFDVRLPAHRRLHLGGGDMQAAASCSVRRPGAPRSPARACSTRTATACWPHPRFRTARLRPDLRLRARRDHPGRLRRMYEARASSTTSP
jgi:hypothetical protein